MLLSWVKSTLGIGGFGSAGFLRLAAERAGEQGEKNKRAHQLPPEGAWVCTVRGLSIGGRRISCSRLGRSRFS